jgi:uncharacterized protein YgiM (DUF1202 family)
MTEQEIQEFLDVASSKPEHHYEALGLIPFSEFNDEFITKLKNNYTERLEYIDNQIIDSEIKTKAKGFINSAKPVLLKEPKKRQYDIELKPSLIKRLVRLIKNSIIDDKQFSQDERNLVESNGKHFGFKPSEIRDIIEEQRKIYKFIDSSGSKEIETASTATKAGSPKLEIHNNTNFTKNGEFLFDNVKLTETRREVITIKNGGGGTLDATAIYSAKWIDVIPKKIHQSNLPQDVTIVIDPSKDKSLKNGSAIMDTINLSYASVGGTLRVPIVIKMAIEGHYGLVKRQTKYATIVSSVLAGLTLLYIFSNYDFSGWAIFGFVVSAIAIGIGAFAAIEDEKNMAGLIIGGIILLITNWLVFVLALTIIITFYASKFIFEKNPFRNELIAAIPIGSFIVFLALLFSTNSLNNSNYNYNKNNYKNSNTQQNNYQPTISVNRNAYIKADPSGNIRSGKSKTTQLLASLSKGEKVYLIEQDKATKWYRVKYRNNKYGYVSDVVVSFDYVPKNIDDKQTTKVTNSTSPSSNFITRTNIVGLWRIDNGSSQYLFYSSSTGNYTNSRGRKTSFRWSLNNNNLKIILNTDNTIWNWKINSFSNSNISMYSSKNKLNRSLSKM